MLKKTVLVTGGAGYVGSVLVPRLLSANYNVKVLDLYLYGDDVLKSVADHPGLEQIKGDLRDQKLLRESLSGCDHVIHLACISNDPSFDLEPALSRSINYDAFRPLVEISRDAGVRRFIYASSSSVYGVSDAESVDEEHPRIPITDYNRYKALCEDILLPYQSSDFIPVVIRPATVCGYSPRQRFDLTVNILTNHAVNNGKIKVFGGQQMRPNLHIDDMVDLYLHLLEEKEVRISGKIFNAGYQNHTVLEIAEIVKSVVSCTRWGNGDIEIEKTPSDDIRSYHISSSRIQQELGFSPKRSLQDAVQDLCAAFDEGRFDHSMTNSVYFNVQRMKEQNLQ